MEHQGVDLQSVALLDGNIVISYANGATETLPNNADTYKLFYEAWLKENPPFISDIHKLVMRNIILATINNDQKSITELTKFFSSGNEENVAKFLTYMRNRLSILPEQKAIWRTTTQ